VVASFNNFNISSSFQIFNYLPVVPLAIPAPKGMGIVPAHKCIAYIAAGAAKLVKINQSIRIY
jgi:hypothetical protein